MFIGKGVTPVLNPVDVQLAMRYWENLRQRKKHAHFIVFLIVWSNIHFL